MCSAGESTLFGIRKSKAAVAETLLQQSILFFQIFDRIELSTIDPASKQR